VKALIAFVTCLSSFLLFWLELFFAKTLLPHFGGGAQIWTVCLAAFQLLLLLGYGYAWAIGKLKPTKQLAIHIILAIAAVATMPLQANFWQNDQLHPTMLIFSNVMLAVGLPLGFLSTTSSMLQTAYNRAFGRSPYWLYAFSNIGSLAALMLFPTVLEPNLTLKVQTFFWSAFFSLTVLLIVGLLTKLTRMKTAPTHDDEAVETVAMTRLTPPRWWVCAFIPSTLLSGITAYVTAEIAPNPMTWAIFLGIYLVSLILVFLPEPITPPRSIGNTLILFIAAFLVLELNSKTYFDRDTLIANIAFFSILCWFYHGLLVQSKPEPAKLSQFYFVMALGGASGAIFNALLAPLIFPRITEYQVVLALSSPLLLSIATTKQWTWLPHRLWTVYRKYTLRLVAFAFVVLAILYANPAFSAPDAYKIERIARSFYASYMVATNDHTRMLIHGRTLHGRESLDPNDRTPGTYYAPGGPIANVFDLMPKDANIAAIGLGVGEIVNYAQPEQNWTFYEIDPLIVEIAQKHFHHLSKAPKPPQIIVGDGRLKMAQSTNQHDLIVVDAFNSDAIPVHLLTQESLEEVFLPHLKDNGIVAYHITNTFLDLEPILDRLARELKLTALTRTIGSSESDQHGQSSNQWVVLSRTSQMTDTLTQEGWKVLKPGKLLWTDNFSSVRTAMRQRK
jgi:hypothetical protein